MLKTVVGPDAQTDGLATGSPLRQAQAVNFEITRVFKNYSVRLLKTLFIH